METLSSAIRGKYRDVLRASNGTLLYDSGWHSNTIVDRCRILLAGFICDDANKPNGIQYLAVGSGDPTWDANGPPPPPTTGTALVQKASDLPIAFAQLHIAYLDATGVSLPPTAPPTSRLQITASLAPGYPTPPQGTTVYPLREFGLFGSFNNQDYMINNVRHPVIYKEASTSLVRVVQLYF